MSRLTPRRTLVTALVAGAVAAVGGCGAAAVPAPSGRPPVIAAGAGSSLAYSEAASEATWAVLPMGATGGADRFWQLFVRAAGQSRWTLHTPPDVATSGALAIGGLAGTSLVLAVRPSLYLAFSPVSLTADGGQHWVAGPPAPALAADPDALAATPGGRALLALGKSGQVSASSAAERSWSPLISARALAASPAGQACGLTRLSAVGFGPGGEPLLAGNCRRPGIAGIFTETDGAWRAGGPSLPPSLAGASVQVLRLVTSPGVTTALLFAGSQGGGGTIAVAWLDEHGRWTVSAPPPLGGASVRTAAFGATGGVAVVQSSGRAEIVPGPGGSWTLAPNVPPGHAVTIALPPGGPVQALAATRGRLTVWQLGTSAGAWTKAQTIEVPIQYGSSG